jgi:hypothetical protein
MKKASKSGEGKKKMRDPTQIQVSLKVHDRIIDEKIVPDETINNVLVRLFGELDELRNLKGEK